MSASEVGLPSAIKAIDIVATLDDGFFLSRRAPDGGEAGGFHFNCRAQLKHLDYRGNPCEIGGRRKHWRRLTDC